MAVDMFLKLDGIKGEATDGKNNPSHNDEIRVLAWSWGMSNSGSAHLGSGAGSGKVNVQDLSFTKYIDLASPELMLSCCSGTHIKKAQLTVRKASGGSPLEYVIIKLEEILVASVSTGGSGGEDLLTENVTLNFAKVDVEYTQQVGDKAGAKKMMGWDIPANAKR